MSIFSRLRNLGRRELTCQDANTFLAAYLDGALDERTSERFAKHINRCPTCSSYLNDYESTVDLSRATRVQNAPPELVAETLEFLRRRLKAED